MAGYIGLVNVTINCKIGKAQNLLEKQKFFLVLWVSNFSDESQSSP